MKIVECIDVNKSYRQGRIEVTALKDFSLTIEKGEFAAVAGPSGSGKTTLLNLVGGLDLADSGSIVVDGQAFDQMSQSQLAKLRLLKVGFVFQAYNLIPVLTAYENIEYPLVLVQRWPKKKRRKRVEELLEAVDMSDQADKRPDQLSGGQKQRVAVARALMGSPSLLLCDEPTGNLDSQATSELLDLFEILNDQGLTLAIGAAGLRS